MSPNPYTTSKHPTRATLSASTIPTRSSSSCRSTATAENSAAASRVLGADAAKSTDALRRQIPLWRRLGERGEKRAAAAETLIAYREQMKEFDAAPNAKGGETRGGRFHGAVDEMYKRGGAVGEGAKIENSQGYRDWLKANGKNDNASMRRVYANETVRKLTDLFGKAFRSMGFGEGEGKRNGLKFSFVDRIEDAKSGGANEVRFARRAPRGDAIESNIRQMLKHGKVYDTEDSLHFAYSAEQNEIAFFRDNGDLTFDIMIRRPLTDRGINDVERVANKYRSIRNGESFDRRLQEARSAVRSVRRSDSNRPSDGTSASGNGGLVVGQQGDGSGFDRQKSVGSRKDTIGLNRSSDQIPLRDSSNNIVGSFDRRTGEVKVLNGVDPNVAASALTHEIGHAARLHAERLAERGDRTLLDAMDKVVADAPESLKKQIAKEYGELKPGEFADEVWAHFAEGRYSDAMLRAATEHKAWYTRAWDAVKRAVVAFCEKAGITKPNAEKICDRLFDSIGHGLGRERDF